MRVKAELVKSYIQGSDIEGYEEEWFFEECGHIFVNPSYEIEHRETVGRIFQQIKASIEGFIPCNVEIWDKLFFNWREIIDKVTINLIVGYPEPYDATVIKAPDGESNVILDLGLWAKYEGKCDIPRVVNNLLTHELCHVCIGKTIQGIDEDIESEDYLINLDANTFHEAFAHLISFEDKAINEVQWDTEEWAIVIKNCRERMKEALVESNLDKQQEFLQEAFCGNYKEKYAAISGMFYLVDCWREKGLVGLEEVFKSGYHGFATRTVN
ncbi:MAG: hypothetical protein RR128_02230 [Clostridium sp.]